jgi:hypothetical protein
MHCPRTPRLCSGHGVYAGLADEVRHSIEPGYGIAVLRQVVERRQSVRLPPAELRYERKHWRGVLGLSREPAEHHTGVFPERAREAGAGEELVGLAVVLGRRAGHYLFQRDGELVRVEGSALRTSFRGVATLYQGSMRQRLSGG